MHGKALPVGGEDGECPIEAAARELFEETGLSGGRLLKLNSLAYIPVLDVVDKLVWGDDVLEIPEYAFVYEATSKDQVRLSEEHADYKWSEIDLALHLLEWESNKAALIEAQGLIQRGVL